MSLDNLPVEWLLTSIENIAEVLAGGTPKANDPENFVEPPNGIGWLTPADLSGYSNKYIGHGKRDLSEKGYKTSSAKLMPKGSVVFSSRAPIGYVAIASNEISTNQGFKNFVIDENISSEYLYYYLKSIRDLAESLGTGTTFKELSGSACKKLPFVLAPLAEQQEIVRQLDVMLTQVEQIKARLDAIPAILKKFRQSVLADAVSGKLLEQDVNFTNYKLSEISEFQNGYAFKSNWFTKEGDHQVIKLGNIRDDFLYIENAPSFVEVEVANQFKKFKPNVGDLLISMTGTRFKQDYGYVCQVSEDANLLINQRVGRIIPNKTLVNSSYLLLCLRSDLFRQEFFKGETGGVNQGNVGSKHIEQIELNIPSLEYQNGIVDLTDTLFRSVEHIDASTQSAQKRVNLLTQSILAKAFSGELTAEWREQHQELITGINSAESLLAKIQKEREASKPAKKTRKKKEV